MAITSLNEIGGGTVVANGTRFEHFASDFLKKKGLTFIEGVAIGPDGGKDLIFGETFVSKTGAEIKYRWLISCKYRSSGTIGIDDEVNIVDRLRQHNCNGFLGFYSVDITSGLQQRIDGLANSVVAPLHMFERYIYSGQDIIMELNRDLTGYSDILRTYLPVQYEGLVGANAAEDNFSKGEI